MASGTSMKNLPLFLALCVLPVSSGFGQSDFLIVRERVISEILETTVDDQLIFHLIQIIREDGSWQGINYENVSNTGFEHSMHLANMVDLSLAFNRQGTGYYQSERISRLVNRSMGFWVRHDFICENWWWNQIGTPQALVTVLLIMDEHLDPDIRRQMLPIIGRAHLDAPGARPGGDRIKIAGIAARKALATEDAADFQRIIGVIGDEIRFHTGDRGMQHDYSFHHRVDRVNNTVSYGRGYAAAFTEWAGYVKGTRYAIPIEKVKQLVDYYLDGICKQMVYGIYTDKGVKNRSISRREEFRPHDTSIPRTLLQVTNYRSNELEQIIRLREGNTEPSDAFSRFFWQSEHFVCQRPEFYTSVRMFSRRNRNMEVPYNSEGLKNHHKGDGANFLSLQGDEYVNIWPVYDWQKIPGTTVLQKPALPAPGEIQKDGLTMFVGAVTDGLYGAVGFDFISPHDPVKARKSWFFFDDFYLCTGAGIESATGYPVVTTVNQCLLIGDVMVKRGRSTKRMTTGSHRLEEAEWVHHDHVGYLFPDTSGIRLSNQVERGTWFDISKQWSTPKDTVSREVFKLWIDHGARPQGRRGGLVNSPMIARDVTYQYVVIPSVKLNEMKKRADELTGSGGVEILSNNRWLQAVRHRNQGVVQMIFFRAGTLKFSGEFTVSLDSPGAVLLKMEGSSIREITVSDPSRLMDRLHITMEHQGSEPVKVVIDLPAGPYAGQSTTVPYPQL